jgi:ribosomal protein L37AE/L43A
VDAGLFGSSPLVVGIAVVAGVGLVYGWRNFQRCPHCGRLVRRVINGWKRCPACGRQYRRGLRVR